MTFSRRWGSPHQARRGQTQKAHTCGDTNEDDREDWDERDMAEYERNKQFEKLVADIVA